MLLYTNILISFDDAETACLAVEKALLFFGRENTRFHLLKCTEKKYASLPGDKAASCEEEMEILKQKISRLKGQFQIISDTILRKNFSVRLKKYFLSAHIDLVMAVCHQRCAIQPFYSHSFYHRLSIKMNVPVIMFRYRSLVQGIRSVFLPVTGVIPAKSIRIALDVSAMYHAQIYIATSIDNSNSDMQKRSDSFYQIFKTLAESGHLPLYKVFQGKKARQAILHYGEQIRADMILINPEKQHSFSEWFTGKLESMRLLFTSAYIITMKPHLSPVA